MKRTNHTLGFELDCEHSKQLDKIEIEKIEKVKNDKAKEILYSFWRCLCAGVLLGISLFFVFAMIIITEISKGG